MVAQTHQANCIHTHRSGIGIFLHIATLTLCIHAFLALFLLCWMLSVLQQLCIMAEHCVML